MSQVFDPPSHCRTCRWRIGLKVKEGLAIATPAIWFPDQSWPSPRGQSQKWVNFGCNSKDATIDNGEMFALLAVDEETRKAATPNGVVANSATAEIAMALGEIGPPTPGCSSVRPP